MITGFLVEIQRTSENSETEADNLEGDIGKNL